MPGRISLALALHNHQPVGNFGWVIEEVYRRSYEPLLAALERHPRIRLALHYTGPLLDWLAAERPEFLDRLRALVGGGRVELMGGGYYEPVLASLPEADRLAQLRLMGDAIERIGGRRPTGAWLAERVWEPDLPVALVDGGYRWTILDDAHFRAASIDEFGPVGLVHDRRPGPSPDGLRVRQEPALPDPVRGGGGRDRLPRRARLARPATCWPSWATTARSSAPGRTRTSTAGARTAGSIASSRR